MEAFRRAVEARYREAMIACLADDVVFTSPVAFGSYSGKQITASILTTVMEVFVDFRYLREISDPPDSALIFEATVADKALTGCDFIHVDEDGLIDTFMVMVRPLSGARALAAEMGARWEGIKHRAFG